MFCVMVGRGSHPKMQAVPTFLVAKGVGKLDTSRVWWGAVPSFDATNFLSHWWEAPSSKHGKKQITNGHQHTHETRPGICLFPCVPVCFASRLPLGLPALGRRCSPWRTDAAAAVHGAEAFLPSEHTCSDAPAPSLAKAGPADLQEQAQAYGSWAGPVCLAVLLTSKYPDLQSHPGTAWPWAKRTSFITSRAATCQ